MGDLDIFIKVLIAIAAGIATIGGAVTFVEHIIDRISVKRNTFMDKVSQHDKIIEKHSEYLDSDNKRLKEMEETNKLIMRGVMGIITHEIDGNHTDQLKATMNDMQEYLINRQANR